MESGEWISGSARMSGNTTSEALVEDLDLGLTTLPSTRAVIDSVTTVDRTSFDEELETRTDAEDEAEEARVAASLGALLAECQEVEADAEEADASPKDCDDELPWRFNGDGTLSTELSLVVCSLEAVVELGDEASAIADVATFKAGGFHLEVADDDGFIRIE